MTQKVLVPLVDGFEEIEAIAVIDILRRAGIEVTTAGFDKLSATGSHKLTVQTDSLFEDIKGREFDMIVLPGGPGAKTLRANESLAAVLKQYEAKGKWLAAICAAPTVLAKAGLLEHRAATCYPSAEADMAGARLSHEEVVVDGKVITSRGAGTAIPFALWIVEALLGVEKAAEIGRQIVFRASEVA